MKVTKFSIKTRCFANGIHSLITHKRMPPARASWFVRSIGTVNPPSRVADFLGCNHFQIFPTCTLPFRFIGRIITSTVVVSITECANRYAVVGRRTSEMSFGADTSGSVRAWVFIFTKSCKNYNKKTKNVFYSSMSLGAKETNLGKSGNSLYNVFHPAHPCSAKFYHKSPFSGCNSHGNIWSRCK